MTAARALLGLAALAAVTLVGGSCLQQRGADGGAAALPTTTTARSEEAVAALAGEVDTFIRGEMQRQRLVGLGVGIVRNGQIVHLEGYGWEDRENEVPVDARRTMFRWASISKTLTAVVAQKLALEGRLDIDRPVSSYVPEFPAPTAYLRECAGAARITDGGKDIECMDGFFDIPLPPDDRHVTARMLLGHQAGVMHYANGREAPIPPVELMNSPVHNRGFIWALRYIAGKPLVNKPRERVSYTTFGFNLLGAVVERAGAKPLPEQVRESIAEPLGITTLQPDYEWEELPRRAVGYELEQQSDNGAAALNATQMPPIVRQGSNDVSWKLPSGGFISTVEDLARYCAGLMTQEVLPRQALEAMWTAQKLRDGSVTEYGFGFQLGMHDGHRHVGHIGVQEKAQTILQLSPDDEICVVVMSNSTHADPVHLALGVEEIVHQIDDDRQLTITGP